MVPMANEEPEPKNPVAQRAELEAVLASEQFQRAPALSLLLKYLCDKLFDGESHQIKEYSVGVEVFRRGDGFDQNTDSIVRVEANRLRKRLTAYYSGEGAAHRLRITIPLGQYVPQFEVAEPRATIVAAPLEPVAETSASTPAKRMAGRRGMWIAGALALVVAVLVGALLILYQRTQSARATVAQSNAAPIAETVLGPPVGEEIRILAGSGRGFVDHAGKLWNADAWFDGGIAVKSDVQNIWRTLNPDFYRTSRQGSFRYAIPLNKGIYELRLHFAETVYGPESTGAGGEGSRLMTVSANGKTLLTRFDVVADAGGSRTADVKVFTGIQPAGDGLLHLEFAGEEGRQATVSAIEILPGFRGHIRPVRVLARQSPYYSNDSHWWSPDNYFEGGQLASYSAAVKGTDDPELYESERWGNFTYAIPVTQGRYTVTLYFAARHGEWDQPDDHQTPVEHIFNVFCNGNALVKNFDLAREARQTDIVMRKFSGLEPNAQGKLILSFVPVEGYATVSGIEVLPQG